MYQSANSRRNVGKGKFFDDAGMTWWILPNRHCQTLKWLSSESAIVLMRHRCGMIWAASLGIWCRIIFLLLLSNGCSHGNERGVYLFPVLRRSVRTLASAWTAQHGVHQAKDVVSGWVVMVTDFLTDFLCAYSAVYSTISQSISHELFRVA